jgi:hypothetical protein
LVKLSSHGLSWRDEFSGSQTPKAITAGSSVAPRLSEGTTERSSIGSGSTSTSKNAGKPSSTWRRDSGSRTPVEYDVSDPFSPKKISSFRLGGVVSRAAHPSMPKEALNGGPQMVEISRDGKRLYFTNGLYTPWDEQFYPDGVRGWMVKVDVKPGGMELDRKFFLKSDAMRTHQVRLEGADASSDSYCYV